jgi:hypothetical protein
MEIKSQKDLIDSVEKASDLLQAIHQYCGRKAVPEAKIRFPRGFLRTCDEIRKGFEFISENHLKSNIAYTVMLSDSIRWLLIRTDITSTAKEMLIKLYIVLVGSIVEACLNDTLKGKCAGGYLIKSKFLHDQKIITQKLNEDLDYIWNLRCNIHLIDIPSREYENEYSINNLKRCVRALEEITNVLKEKPVINKKR